MLFYIEMAFFLSFINNTTMYRLMLYFMSLLVSVSIVLSAFGILTYSAFDILLQTILFVGSCWLFSLLFARIFKTDSNTESSLITGLILSVIVGPVHIFDSLLLILIISLVAMGSKYILAFRNEHIFNPAAFGIVFSALVLGESASWWIGSQWLLPIILLGGLITAYKIKRLPMVFHFLLVYLVLLGLFSYFEHDLETTFFILKTNIFVAPAILFFAFVMLIEPLTAPQTKRNQIYFSLFVGFVIFAMQKIAPDVPYLLETSLLFGNIFSRLIEPNFRQNFILLRKEKLSPSTWAFWFKPERLFSFRSGQFAEYTLSHENEDSRGMRRFFSIASSPTEDKVLLVSNFSADRGSSYKRKLFNLSEGHKVIASKVGGDFTLPNDSGEKFVFIAGGVGITPFRSMIKSLIDKGEKRDIILLYGVKGKQEILFQDIFKKAEEILGMKSVYVLSDDGLDEEDEHFERGYINRELIERNVADWHQRVFFISGPPTMVSHVSKILKEMGVKRKNIKRDYFQGYN